MDFKRRFKGVLKDAYKGYTLDQDKMITPEETIQRFKERLRGVDLDILSGTMRIDNGRLGIPIYFSLCGKDAEEVIGTKKQMGKGGTPQQSEASAVMELAERFSFFSFYKNKSNFFVEEYRHIREKAIPFEWIARSVHDHSGEQEAAEAIFSRLPLRWTWGFDLTNRREILIPFDWFYTINEFNGPCAGNCVEEALIQGICEIVERHVSSLISRNKIKAPLVSTESAQNPLVLDLLGKYQRAGIRLYINDFTMDTGIPSLGVLAYDPSTFPERSEIVWTAGTTPSPQKALSRALTEVAQLAGDFNTSSNYVASGLPKFKNLEEAAFVMDPGKEIALNALPDLSHENMKVEVERCVAALEKAGLPVIAVDVAHPKLEIPAFYTILPGAHFRERASGTSLGMFCAKLIANSEDKAWAADRLHDMETLLPGKYYIRFFQGLCLFSMNQPEKAIPFFQGALDLSPKEEDIPSIYSYMGQCMKDLGHYRQALEAMEMAEKYDSERTDLFNLMGYCHFKLGEFEKAIEVFRKAIALNPSSAIDYANIATNYREMGDKAKAIQYYRLALELDAGIDFAREGLERLLSCSSRGG